MLDLGQLSLVRSLEGAYVGRGSFGQLLYVLPREQIVLAIMGSLTDIAGEVASDRLAGVAFANLDKLNVENRNCSLSQWRRFRELRRGEAFLTRLLWQNNAERILPR